MIKSNQRGFSPIAIILIVALVGIIGASGYYVYQSNNKTNNELKNIGGSQSTAKDTKPTPTATAQATAKNELDTLKTFCLGTDQSDIIANLVYVESEYGKFGDCSVTDKQRMGGVHVIAYIKDGAWFKIFAGNGVMDSNYCEQYKLPIQIDTLCKY